MEHPKHPVFACSRKRHGSPDYISQNKPWPHTPITTAVLQVSTPGKGNVNFTIIADIQKIWLIY
jgi:hypothetical protein